MRMQAYQRRTLGMTVALAISATAAACANSGTSAGTSATGGSAGGSQTVKIAVLEPFSGSFGTYGPTLEESMKVAAAKINAQGGLLGRKVEVITRDNGLDPTKTVNAARELAGDPSVSLVEGPSFTALFNASKNIYEQAQKLNCQVAVNGDDALQGLKFAFRAAPSISKKVEGVLAYAAEKANVKTFGLVVAKDASGLALDEALKAIAPKHQLDYKGAQFFNPGAQTQVPQVTALKDVDAIFLSATANDAAVTAQNARAAGFKGKFLAVDGLVTNFSYFQLDPSAIEGTLLSYAGADYLTRKPESEWPAKYRETIDAIAASAGYLTDAKSGMKLLKGTTLAVDCATQWAAAVKAANSFDNTKVADAWSKLQLSADEMPTGIPVAFSPDSHESFKSYTQIGVYELRKDAKGWYLDEVVKPSL
jgi:branched-chain amino acid transport system substrate-binding protein